MVLHDIFMYSLFVLLGNGLVAEIEYMWVENWRMRIVAKSARPKNGTSISVFLKG